jgi:hypothetical protein
MAKNFLRLVIRQSLDCNCHSGLKARMSFCVIFYKSTGGRSQSNGKLKAENWKLKKHIPLNHLRIERRQKPRAERREAITIADCLGLADDGWKSIFKDNHQTKTKIATAIIANRRQLCRGATSWPILLGDKVRKRRGSSLSFSYPPYLSKSIHTYTESTGGRSREVTKQRIAEADNEVGSVGRIG